MASKQMDKIRVGNAFSENKLSKKSMIINELQKRCHICVSIFYGKFHSSARIAVSDSRTGLYLYQMCLHLYSCLLGSGN